MAGEVLIGPDNVYRDRLLDLTRSLQVVDVG